MNDQINKLRIFGDDDGLKAESISCKHPTHGVEVVNLDEHDVQAGQVWEFSIVAAGRGRKAVHKVRLLRQLKEHSSKLVLPGFFVEPLDLKRLEICLKNRRHILLRGHKGTGKTTLVELLAQVVGAEYAKIDCQLIGEPSDVIGKVGAESGTVFFKKNDFTLMCEQLADELESGGDPNIVRGVAHLDEFNRALARNMDSVHPLADKTRRVSVTTSEGTISVWMPPTVILAGTMNFSGGIYNGTNKTDGALLERFQLFTLWWPPAEFEEELILNEYKIDPTHARQIVSAANQLREAVRSGGSGLVHAPSPRRTVDAGMYVEGGLSLNEAVECSFLEEYENSSSDERQTAREKIASVLNDIATMQNLGG